jgi:hypothetical protein
VETTRISAVRAQLVVALAAAVAMVAVAAAPAFGSQTWVVQSSPNPNGSLYSELHGISCASSSNCVAVGSWTDGNKQRTLVERWNGTKWSIQASPTPKDGGVLEGVSCVSGKACMAVGNAQRNGAMVTLTMRWNGTAWKVVDSPNAVSSASFLGGVSCTSASSCVAVGGAGPSQQASSLTLVERWNGTNWKIVKSPNQKGFTGNRLMAVSCSLPTACTAVGYSTGGSLSEKTLAERWNGTKWSIQKVAQPNGSTLSAFGGVSCPTDLACTATGVYVNASGSLVTLAERWNGTSWKVQKTPNFNGAMASLLTGVSCVSAKACTSVGWAQTIGSQVVFAEQWDGTTWAMQTVPIPGGAQKPTLEGVACVSAQVCHADGGYEDNSGVGLTLIEASS